MRQLEVGMETSRAGATTPKVYMTLAGGLWLLLEEGAGDSVWLKLDDDGGTAAAGAVFKSTWSPAAMELLGWVKVLEA